MSLRTCYAELGGSLDSVLGRLPSERLVQKFVLKFLNEGSFCEMAAAVQAKDGEATFRAAHTMKGVCLNLSFDRLYASSNQLCEAVRHGWTDEAAELFEIVVADYQQTVEAIQKFQTELES